MGQRALVAVIGAVVFSWLTGEAHAQWPNDTATCPPPPVTRIPGLFGAPHQPTPIGGCRCNNPNGRFYSQLNPYWPRPMAVLPRINARDNYPTDPCVTPRLRDRMDRLAKVKLLPNVRCDNGYVGPGCDPYGYLGESRRGVTPSPSHRQDNQTGMRSPYDPPNHRRR